MSRLDSLVLEVLPCLWGKLRNRSFVKVSKEAVMLFWVTGVALRDIPTCLHKCKKSFCVGAILLQGCQKMTIRFRARGSRQRFGRVHVHFAWQDQHFRRVVLCVLANRIGRAASSRENVQLPWQAWDMDRLSCCLAGAACGADTSHFALGTSHSTTLSTPHLTPQDSTLYTLPSAPCTLHFTLYTLHSALSTFHSPLLHCTLYTPHYAHYTHTLHSTLHTWKLRLHTCVKIRASGIAMLRATTLEVREIHGVKKNAGTL